MYDPTVVLLGVTALVLFIFLWSMLCYRAFNGSMVGWVSPVIVSTYMTIVAVIAVVIVPPMFK
jgi:uncharacterized membrane protein